GEAGEVRRRRVGAMEPDETRGGLEGRRGRGAGSEVMATAQPGTTLGGGHGYHRHSTTVDEDPMTHAPAAAGTADTAADDPGHSWHLSNRERLEILGAIMLALFLFALDQTVVGTALPIIATKLHGQELYTWAFTIYLLTSTISGPI